MVRLLIAVSVVALTTAAAGMPAAAQEPTDNAAAGDSQEVVVTAQKRNETQVLRSGSVGVLGDKDAADVPFSVKSYNAALILNQQPQTLGQVLDNDPSIRTTYGFGNAAEQFVVRGFTLFSDDVGLDGLYGIVPRQLVAPELYDQVQVINGANAFLNGAAPGGSAIGGSVNLVPKRASEGDLTRLTGNWTSDRHFGGAFDISRRFDDGAVGVRLNGAFRSGDVAIDGEFRQVAVVGGAVDYDNGPLRLSLDLDYQRDKVRHLRPKVTLGPTLTTIPRVPSASHNYGQDFTYTTLRDVFGEAKLEYDLASNAKFYLKAGARDGAEHGIYDGITVNDALTGAATGNALYVPRADNNEAVTGGVRVKLAADGITQEFNFGASAVWQVNRNAYDFRYGPGFAGYATNLYATPQVALPSSTLVGGDLDDPFPVSRTRLFSAFASDTIGLWGDRILIVGGLRLQKITTISYAYTDDLFGGTGIKAGQRNGGYSADAVTPVVGLVVKPVEGLSLFANRVEGLQPGQIAGAGTINQGEVFQPFKSTQYEAGGKYTYHALTASVAVFQIKQPSAYTIQVPNPGNPNLPLNLFGVFGQQRNSGIEFSLDGEVARGLRLIGGATILDAKLTRNADATLDGNKAQGVPDYTINGDVEWDLPFLRGATLTGRVIRTGEQKANPANTLALPGWTRVDLGARYVALVGAKPVTFRVGVDNVANKRYWASAFDSFVQSLLQGAPRTIKASATVDF